MNNSMPNNYSGNLPPLPFGQLEIVVAAVTLIPMCVFGTIANVCTIAAVLHSNKLKSTFYYFLMSLSVSDLISAIISPLALYRLTWGYEKWEWTSQLCKFFWYADVDTSVITSGHVLLFAVLRFVSIHWPRRFNPTLKQVKIVIFVDWTICSVVTSPIISWFEVVVRDRTDPTPSSHWASCGLTQDNTAVAKEYTKYFYSIFLYLPIILVICFTIAIALRIMILRRKRMEMRGQNNSALNPNEVKRRKKENQVLAQLFLIVASFLFGYIPRTAYHFSTVNATVPASTDVGAATYTYNWWFAFMEYLCIRISECLNPVFYNLSSKKMRDETKEMLETLWRKLKRLSENDLHAETNSPPTVYFIA